MNNTSSYLRTSVLSEHAEASLRAAEHMSGRYHAAYEQIRSLTHSASEKLARFLLESSVTDQESS